MVHVGPIWCEQRDFRLCDHTRQTVGVYCLPYGKLQAIFSLIQVPLHFLYIKKRVRIKPIGLTRTLLVRAKGLEPPRSPTRS